MGGGQGGGGGGGGGGWKGIDGEEERAACAEFTTPGG